MLAFDQATYRDLLTIQDDLRGKLRVASSLEQSAQLGVQAICNAFSSDVALARMFMTLPFGQLPEELRKKTWNIVEAQSLQSQMHDSTPVLTLMGTCGTDPEWCDRRLSQGHSAIPLSSKSFVDSIPMVARMLQEMGIDLGMKRSDRMFVEKILGSGWIGMFHVEDARHARDDQGRRVIPSVDFVEANGIRSVFGLGKAYGNGSIACFVIFANKIVHKEKAEALIPFVNLFKAQTLELVSRKAFFASAP